MIFFYGYDHRRDLLSFPTRRSSDLEHAAGGEVVGERRGSERHRSAVIRAGEDRGVRSEEHTSELQSQFHLVCRLLLEKKKQSLVIITSRRSSTRTGQRPWTLPIALT